MQVKRKRKTRGREREGGWREEGGAVAEKCCVAVILFSTAIIVDRQSNMNQIKLSLTK